MPIIGQFFHLREITMHDANDTHRVLGLVYTPNFDTGIVAVTREDQEEK